MEPLSMRTTIVKKRDEERPPGKKPQKVGILEVARSLVVGAAIAGVAIPTSLMVNDYLHQSSRPHITFVRGTPVDKSFKPVSIHRFHPGDIWSFSIHSTRGNGTATIKVLDRKEHAPDGKDCMLMEIHSTVPGEKNTSSIAAFRQDASGSELLYGLLGKDGKSFHWGVAPHPYSIRIKSPIFPGGGWISSVYLDDHRGQLFIADVKKAESVTVAAGKFKTLLVHEQTIYGINRMIIRTHQDDSWIAPSVGFPVKIVSRDPKDTTVQELVSYHLAGK